MAVQFWDQAYRQFKITEAFTQECIFDTGQKEVSYFLELMPKDAAVLDFGCGYGRNAIPLAGAGYRVAVADISTHAMEACQTYASYMGVRVQEIPCDDGRLLSAPQRFSGVLAWNVLDHMTLEEAQAAILEFKRVCKNNGVVLCTFNDSKVDAFHEVLADGSVRYLGGDNAGKLVRNFTNSDVVGLFDDDWELVYYYGVRNTRAKAVLARKIGKD